MTRFIQSCTCGATISINAPKIAIDKIVAVWNKEHSGDGHAPCDHYKARTVREKIDEKVVADENAH